MLWEKFEEYLLNNKIEIRKKSEVFKVEQLDDLNIVSIKDSDGNIQNLETKNILFSSPLLEFIEIVNLLFVSNRKSTLFLFGEYKSNPSLILF